MKSNKTWHLIFFSLLLAIGPFQARAAGPCADLKAKEVFRFQQGSSIELVACAENISGPVSDLTVLKVQGDAIEHVFDGDPAFKSYRVQKNASSIVIQEALSTINAMPFIETKISCLGGKCLSSSTCIWKKSKPDEAIVLKVQAEMKKKNPSVSDIQMERIFYSALNGSVGASKIFEADGNNADAGGSEAFETYKADLAKLKKLGGF